jgi:hypothetical protein
MIKRLILGLSIGLLSGCAGEFDGAVEACYNDVMARVRDNLGTVDRKAMAESAKKNEDGTVQIDSTIVFRGGTPQEKRQTFSCTVALTGPDGKPDPRVVRLIIQW